MAFSPKKRGYPAWLPDFTPRSDVPATPVHTQGAEDTERVTSVGIDEVGQGDTVVLKEEDQSAALHLNHRRSRRSDHTPPTGPTEDEEVEVPQANA
nr:uncharacterized protein LOC109180246 [Ipomoea trifida]